MNPREDTLERPTQAPDGERIRILVADDETLFAKAVCKRLKRAGHACELAGTLAEARRRLAANPPDLILLDMRLPDGSGLDFLSHLRESETPEIPVIVITAHGQVEDAVAAMKHQALDYLKKPIDLEELLLTLEKALQNAQTSRRLDYSHQRETRAIEGVQMLGESPAICEIRTQIERIARLSTQAQETPPTVLVLGETGAGKDLAARLLHLRSARHDRPFVHVDCTALPGDLIEAELFGHEKGAFTGAHAQRIGLIEAAEDGTVFLDEIAELPLELQAKLLAVLERRQIRRVGTSRERPVQAWFIAGTNRPIEAMVQAGEFRADLYYRLKVLTLNMPALRERDGDMVLLARHFIQQTARRFGLPQPELSADAIAALRAYPWPGNVRELAHLVERAVLLSNGEPITASILMLEVRAPVPDSAPQRPQTLLEAEAEMIRQALEQAGGNISQAARRLGLTRMTLRYRMQKHGITPGR